MEDDGLATDWVSQAAVIGEDAWVVSSFGVSVIHADGSITPYLEDESDIPDENVSAVAGDAEGNVWLAAFDGLLKFRDGDWTLYNSDNVEEFPYLDAFEGVVVAQRLHASVRRDQRVGRSLRSPLPLRRERRNDKMGRGLAGPSALCILCACVRARSGGQRAGRHGEEAAQL